MPDSKKELRYRMLNIAITIVFILGYLAIAFEHVIKVNKAATALVTGVVCWGLYLLGAGDHVAGEALLGGQLGEIGSILFFLLGAMTIVELIDAHEGFDIIIEKIRARNKGKLLLLIALITFFLSAVLDNLTTTIVMVSMTGKLLEDKEDRWTFAGMIIIAANAGGAWSPIGDVTTTMLWIGGQVTALSLMKSLFLPGLVCCGLPAFILWFRFRNQIIAEPAPQIDSRLSPAERKMVLVLGLGGLLLVPVFKTLAHLPPFMGMMLSLGVIWAVLSFVHRKKQSRDSKALSVVTALQRIDSPSILFFLGILLSIGALQASGVLNSAATWMTMHLKSEAAIGVSLGFLSAIVDNVPLVAAVQKMYSLQVFPQDHFFWKLLAMTTGTGGSAVIIGSAAGVAAMGIEDIDFFWYLKKISWLALIGFLSGAVMVVCMS